MKIGARQERKKIACHWCCEPVSQFDLDGREEPPIVAESTYVKLASLLGRPRSTSIFLYREESNGPGL